MSGRVCNGSALTITTPQAAQGMTQLAVGAGAARAVGISSDDLTFAALGKDGFVASSNRSLQLRESGSYALSGAANMSGPSNSSGTLYLLLGMYISSKSFDLPLLLGLLVTYRFPGAGTPATT